MDPAGPRVIVSLRHTDAVYGVDRASGRIAWKLGGTETARSLDVRGQGSDTPLGGQHDARLLPDGTLTAFDNGTLLDRRPRAVRFRLDLRRRTATLVETVEDRAAPESFCCGSARRGANGSWLVSWGGLPLVSEVGKDGRTNFRLRFADRFSYRAVAIGGRRLRVADLRRAMDRMRG